MKIKSSLCIKLAVIMLSFITIPLCLNAQQTTTSDSVTTAVVPAKRLTSYFINFHLSSQKTADESDSDSELDLELFDMLAYLHYSLSFNLGYDFWYVGVANDLTHVEWVENVNPDHLGEYVNKEAYINSAHFGIHSSAPGHGYVQIGLGMSTYNTKNHVVIPFHAGADIIAFQTVGIGLSIDRYIWLKRYNGVKDQFFVSLNLKVGFIKNRNRS